MTTLFMLLYIAADQMESRFHYMNVQYMDTSKMEQRRRTSPRSLYIKMATIMVSRLDEITRIRLRIMQILNTVSLL